MGVVVVRYKVKPGQVDANVELVERVFARLHADRPDGLRYATFRLADGVSFVHVASVEAEDGSNPLLALPEFAEFTRDIAARCDEPPLAQGATIVGAYRLFGDEG